MRISDRAYRFPSYLFEPVAAQNPLTRAPPPPAPRVVARIESVTLELFDETQQPLAFVAEFVR